MRLLDGLAGSMRPRDGTQGHPRPSSDPSPERGATPDRKARSISPDPRTAEGHPTTTNFGLPQAPNLPSRTCAVPERPARHPATSEQSLLRPRNPSRSEAPSHLRSPSEPPKRPPPGSVETAELRREQAPASVSVSQHCVVQQTHHVLAHDGIPASS